MPTRLDRANAIRALAMDAVQQANSGHPGMPMGMADIAEVLWHDFLKVNPNNPNWFNRDRFVLSNGHGSMLLYALLYLTGFDLSIDEIKNFRQWGSKTPGHPEVDHTPGVETTTGPLGQGFANAVGMALAEKLLAKQFNQKDFNLIDHHTYVFLGDGCLMEGVSHEAASFAGTFKLNKLIAFWDDNHISIDGDTKGWFTENIPERFESYGWDVIKKVDGHDADAIRQAILDAHNNPNPTLICCQTTIGFGSPNKAGTASSHGSPLGDEEIALTKKELHIDYPAFEVPANIHESFDRGADGQQFEAQWQELFNQYQKAYPVLAAELVRRIDGQLPKEFDQSFGQFIEQLQHEGDDIATRKAQQHVLDFIVPQMPELLGGSADLTGSNNTKAKDAVTLDPQEFTGDYISYGVREFGMSAIMNGVALHKGLLPFGGTFLVFSDYAKNAVRMAALMQQHVIFVYSHDSIGLGEDGPTHQPIEQAAALRLIPGLNVWRPCDAVETAAAWRYSIENKTPSAILTTRQATQHEARDQDQLLNINKGGYVLLEPEAQADTIIIATGSEVGIAVQAATQLNAKGAAVRVVSMPCAEVFLAQDQDYQQKVLPDAITKRVAIEAGVTNYWYQFVGRVGKVIGIDHFGASAPAKLLFKEFGFSVEHIVQCVQELN